MNCIYNTGTDVFFNLAAEEYLLKYSPEDFFILWKNDPVVVVGKHQNVFREVNLDYLKENRIDLARRYSGGGTVYQDQGNVNLTFIESTPSANFDKFTDWMIAALQSFDLPIYKDKRRGLFIDGLKISGSAQCIYKERVLYHATLLFCSNLHQLRASLDVGVSPLETPNGKSKVFVESVRSPVTNIADHMAHPMDTEAFMQVILSYFLNGGTGNQLYQLNNSETEAINQLRNTKYVSEEWNLNTL